jgi:membrane-associated phospholipid phosphatase
MQKPYRQRWWCSALTGLYLVWLSSCGGSLPDGCRWGQDVTLLPRGDRLKTAARNAFLDPGTWVPAVGALAFQIDGWDRNLSRWAAGNRPIFGSRHAADQASIYLVDAVLGIYIVTGLATPSGDTPGEWTVNKLKGFSVGAGAVALTSLSTAGLKEAVRRNRPDGSSRRSFPSSTSSLAAVYGSLAAQNLNYLEMPPWGRLGLRGGIAALLSGASWARLEGKYHYPSDVLAGAALGNFIGRFLNDAFIGPNDPNIWVRMATSTRGAMVSLHWAY